MPIAKVKMPDGRIAKFEVPEGTTPEQVTAFVDQQIKVQPRDQENTPITWAKTGEMAVKNFPGDVADVLRSFADTVRHPINFAETTADLLGGGLRNTLPDVVVNANDAINDRLGLDNQNSDRQKALASAFAQLYKDRYGTLEGFKKGISEHPAQILLDASTALTGGGALLSKAPGMANAGRSIVSAGRAIDPILQSARLAGKTAKTGGKVAGILIGELGTHTGGQTILNASKAGRDLFLGSGSKAEKFQEAINSTADPVEMVRDLKTALKDYGSDVFREYESGLAPILANRQPLDWAGIDQAVRNVTRRNVHHGIDINPGAASTRDAIENLVNQFKSKGLATAKDFDALKRAVGFILDDTQPHTTQKAMANEAYGAVKQAITDKLPGYGEVMKNAERGIRQSREIEGTLSLGEKKLNDTALRKLFSIPRNNANTNFGNREKLLDVLEQYPTGKDIKSSLAGHSLSSVAPRGLGKLMASGTAGYGLYAHDPITSGALLALQSPYLMGQTAYGVGAASGAIEKVANVMAQKLLDLGINPKDIPKVLAEINQQGIE